MTTKLEETRLRNHLKETLEELPNNLPKYNQPRLLDDLTFLLCSPLFLYAMSPRLTAPDTETYAPPTPVSMKSNKSDTTSVTSHKSSRFELSHLEIRIRWADEAWATQLVYSDKVLLEGRQLNAEWEEGFVQSFFWFCEEAAFLAWEFKAREGVRSEELEGLGARMWNVQVADDQGWKAPEKTQRSKKREGRAKLKLKIRFRDTERGTAGVWRVE
ncbi:hypothetical protein BDU57DRAFT_584629 [Ampelomyces quisqualis]|uniref:Uncharacterized protein n=1 Tax=Ampelomyces quisqualis TaxID=50730 RepID=A0A6A5R3H2_AMPQU|nr:hypothetical protein BDU57DRAFT_584629 [Ampelomyces quisqualis]